MTRYFLVDAAHDLFEKEIAPAEYDALFAASATEQTGHAAEADALIYSVEDDEKEDQIKRVMYRNGAVWTSIPAAFDSMTIRLSE